MATPATVAAEPTPKDWAGAYSFCSMQSRFPVLVADSALAKNAKDAVIAFLRKECNCTTEAAIYEAVIEYAGYWNNLRRAVEYYRAFGAVVRERLPFIKKSACLKKLAESKTYDLVMAAVQTTLDGIKYHVSNAITSSGSYDMINISMSNLGDGSEEPSIKTLFSVGHELGHCFDKATCMLLDSDKNKNDRHKMYMSIRAAIMPTVQDTNARHEENYFADSFAAIFLNCGLGYDKSKIVSAATELFGSDEEGEEHPRGDSRMVEIRNTLTHKC